MDAKFKVGQVVLYQNGSSFELGVVKSVVKDEQKTYLKQQGFPPKGEPQGEVVIRYMYFVHYHTGNTAALTHEYNLHEIKNLYAFNIERRKAGENNE